MIFALQTQVEAFEELFINRMQNSEVFDQVLSTDIDEDFSM
jgi:hypothetical protein